MAHAYFDDAKERRKDLAGLSSGGLAGATVGAVVGVVLPGVDTALGAAVGAVVGGLAGSLLGRAVMARVSSDDWDPPELDKPFVGAHAPDSAQADIGGPEKGPAEEKTSGKTR